MTTLNPDRDFWGAQFLWGNLGVAHSSFQGATEQSVRGEICFEYLQGSGTTALGLRASVVGDSGFSVPVTLMGHWGPLERFGFFAGVGHTGYSRLALFSDDGANRTSYLGARALAGLQFLGARYKNETRWVWTLEIDQRWVRFGDSTFESMGITFNVGPSI